MRVYILSSDYSCWTRICFNNLWEKRAFRQGFHLQLRCRDIISIWLWSIVNFKVAQSSNYFSQKSKSIVNILAQHFAAGSAVINEATYFTRRPCCQTRQVCTLCKDRTNHFWTYSLINLYTWYNQCVTIKEHASSPTKTYIRIKDNQV